MFIEDRNFHRIQRLPPYVFKAVDELKMAARHRGEDIVDLVGHQDQVFSKPIPEPSAALVFGLGALLVMATRRKPRA